MGYFLNQSRSFLDDNNKKDAYDGGSLGRFEMFLNATAIGAIIAIIGLVALLTNLHERFGGLAVSRFNMQGPIRAVSLCNGRKRHVDTTTVLGTAVLNLGTRATAFQSVRFVSTLNFGTLHADSGYTVSQYNNYITSSSRIWADSRRDAKHRVTIRHIRRERVI